MLELSHFFNPTKSNVNKKYETFTTTPDGVKIAINVYDTGQNRVVIIAHGWFMTKDSKAFSEISEAFCSKYDVISMDFRGHGKSKGFYTFTAKETKDLKAVISFAKSKYSKIYLIGFSLGAASSLLYTAENNDIEKIIVVSPPTDFNKIENHIWKKSAWLSTLKKFELNRYLSIRPSFIMYPKIAPINIVDKIMVPTMFIAGENDPTVFAWHTKKLYQKAICPKKLYIFAKGTHAEDLFLEEKENFIKQCTKWLEDTI